MLIRNPSVAHLIDRHPYSLDDDVTNMAESGKR